MRNSFSIALAAILLFAGVSGMAQTKSTVFGTDHDISGAGCNACHAPHQSSAKGETMLWAQSFPTTASFGIYNSPTMNTTAQEVGGAYSSTNPPNGAKLYTVLCLSCHDGLTTPAVIAATNSHAIANPTNSDGLKNDHPVNLVYNATAESGLEALATVQASALKLFSDGTNQTLQCASCHDVHNNSKTPFLRVAQGNTKAGLCTTCHK